MNDHACACGYEAITAEELGDHIGEMVIPPDDIAPDGQAHAEAARDNRGAAGTDPAGLRCLCGFTSGTATGLDEHLLAAFTGPGVTGPDGREHSSATARR
jgi:hypothetical protein